MKGLPATLHSLAAHIVDGKNVEREEGAGWGRRAMVCFDDGSRLPQRQRMGCCKVRLVILARRVMDAASWRSQGLNSCDSHCNNKLDEQRVGLQRRMGLQNLLKRRGTGRERGLSRPESVARPQLPTMASKPSATLPAPAPITCANTHGPGLTLWRTNTRRCISRYRQRMGSRPMESACRAGDGRVCTAIRAMAWREREHF